MNNPANNKVILTAQNITKVYRSGPETLEVLKGISLTIQRGEILIIMGPSGVGKSTLLNILGTLDRPSSGSVQIDGRDINGMGEEELARFRNRHIGFIFQFHYLLPEFTALENVLMPRMIRGRDWKKDIPRARTLLEEVGLGERLNHRPSELSGGEQQRVAVARALMNQPEIILADEPTGDLDRKNSEMLYELMLALQRKYRQTFVIVTHNEMFTREAHRVIHLWDGQIAEEKVLKPVE